MQSDINQQGPMLVASLLFVPELGIMSTAGSVTDHVISLVGWGRHASYGQFLSVRIVDASISQIRAVDRIAQDVE